MKANQKDKNDLKNMVLITTAFLLLLAVVALSARPAMPTGFEAYTVCAGDTLWNIARLSNGYGKYSTEKIVADIVTNGCDVIVPGEQIFIPRY